MASGHESAASIVVASGAAWHAVFWHRYRFKAARSTDEMVHAMKLPAKLNTLSFQQMFYWCHHRILEPERGISRTRLVCSAIRNAYRVGQQMRYLTFPSQTRATNIRHANISCATRYVMRCAERVVLALGAAGHVKMLTADPVGTTWRRGCHRYSGCTGHLLSSARQGPYEVRRLIVLLNLEKPQFK